MPQEPSDRFIGPSALGEILDLHARTAVRKIRALGVPEYRLPGAKAPRWLLSEVFAALKMTIAHPEELSVLLGTRGTGGTGPRGDAAEARALVSADRAWLEAIATEVEAAPAPSLELTETLKRMGVRQQQSRDGFGHLGR